MSDAEIKCHLTEIAGFTPCDGWAHILDRLKKGDTYYVNRTGEKHKIKVIKNQSNEYRLATR